MASGLHHRVPECILTSWPRAILAASDRPLAGTSNIASGMPCVIPSTVARRIPSARLDLSSGIACFVSGMYRDNRRQLAPRRRQCVCISKKRRRAMRATNISEVISVTHTVAETRSYHARATRKVRHCAIFLRDSSGRPASGPFPAGDCRICPSARLGDTRVKPKFVRGPRGTRARRHRNNRRGRLRAEQLRLAQMHDVAHRRCAEQPAVFAAELRRAFVADCRGHRTDVAALPQQ